MSDVLSFSTTMFDLAHIAEFRKVEGETETKQTPGTIPMGNYKKDSNHGTLRSIGVGGIFSHSDGNFPKVIMRMRLV